MAGYSSIDTKWRNFVRKEDYICLDYMILFFPPEPLDLNQCTSTSAGGKSDEISLKMKEVVISLIGLNPISISKGPINKGHRPTEDKIRCYPYVIFTLIMGLI
jgi:hypothetical protein